MVFFQRSIFTLSTRIPPKVPVQAIDGGLKNCRRPFQTITSFSGLHDETNNNKNTTSFISNVTNINNRQYFNKMSLNRINNKHNNNNNNTKRFLTTNNNGKKRISEEKQQPGFVVKFGQFLLSFTGQSKHRQRIQMASLLFQSCDDQSMERKFFMDGQISDAFRAQHGLLVAHIWMINRRLLIEGEDGKLLQEALFDHLWEETTGRLRAQGINELSLNKYLKEVQEYSFGALCLYDHSQTLESEDEKLESLGNALYRYVYLRGEGNKNLSDHTMLALAKYLQEESDSVMSLPKDAIFQGKLQFGSLPNFHKARIDKIAFQLNTPNSSNNNKGGEGESLSASNTTVIDSEGDGNEDTSLLIEEEKEEIWRKAFSQEGKVYYWNVKTRQTQWEKPEDF